MLKKLKQDICKVKGTPEQIYIMCGTNNIDSIYYGSGDLRNTAQDIEQLIMFIKTTYPYSKINIINILPRTKVGRNDVVNVLNQLIRDFCVANGVNYMKTDHLFISRGGKRLDQYFVSPTKSVSDNCHLNRVGMKRFGKFVKYWTYQHLQN